MKPRILALLLTAVLAAATLTGCSSNPEENTTSDTASATSSALESDARVTPAEDKATSSETVANEDSSATTTPTDGTQTVTTAPPTTSTGSASSSGGATATASRPTTTTGTPPATTSRPAAPSTPSTPTTSAPVTPSTPNTPSAPSTPSQPEKPVRERTIDPQYICDQVNSRMDEVGMIDAVTEGVNAGLTPQQSLDEIHTYMGWTENRENLYVKSNEQVINELLDFLRTLHTQYQRDSAWIEVSYYYDAHYNKVNNIEQAEYVVFILYR